MWNLVIERKPNRDKWKNEHTDTGILNSPTFTGRGIQISKFIWHIDTHFA